MDDPDLELVVTMLNINLGKNKKLLEQCQTLKEYAIYVKKVRTYAKNMKNVEEAVDKAVTECIHEGIAAGVSASKQERGGGNEYF